MSKFRFLSDVSSDGAAFEAFGKTERQLFENAAIALANTTVEIKSIRRRLTEPINLRNADLSLLLLSFLERIIFLKDAKDFFLKEAKLGIEKQGKSWLLQGYLYGEKYEQLRHDLKVDVKSVDTHLFELKKMKNGYRAQVVLKESI